MDINPICWFPVITKGDKSHIYCFTDNGYVIQFPAITISLLKFEAEVPDPNSKTNNSENYDKNVQVCNFDVKLLSKSESTPDREFVSWIDSKTELPLLEVFFSQLNIRPYTQLHITNYVPNVNNKYLLETSYVTTSEDISDEIDKDVNSLFYHFPNDIYQDPVHVTLMVGGKMINHQLLISKTPVSNCRIFSNETDLLDFFFSLIPTYNIFRIYSYNDDLVNRVRRYKLPNISKLSWLPPVIYEKNGILKLKMIGIEQIDILKFMKRFYPGLPSYNLEIISDFYSKSSGTPSEILANLVDCLNINKNLEKLANICAVTIVDVLDLSFKELVNKCLFHLDETTVFSSNSYMSPKIKSPLPGLYSDVYVYDYSEIYVKAMGSKKFDERQETNHKTNDLLSVTERNRDKSKFQLTKVLSELISDSPPEFISNIYHSEFVIKEKLEQLDAVLARKDVFAVGPYILKTVGENTGNWVKKLAHYPNYLVLSHDSYIIQDDFGNIWFYGLSELCHPIFPAAELYIHDFLLYVFDCNSNGEPPIPEVREPELGIVKRSYLQTINGIEDVSEYRGAPLDKLWYRKKLLGYREMLLPFLP